MREIKWKDINIGWKYGITLSLVLLLVVISTGIVSVLLTGIKDDIAAMDRRGDRAIMMTEMGSLTRAKGMRIVAYLENPDQSLVNEYQARRKDFTELAAKLEVKMDTPKQKKLFKEIIENDHKLNDLFISGVVPSMNKGEKKIAIQYNEVAWGLELETVTLLEELRTIVNDEFQEAANTADKSANLVNLVLLISIVISIIIGVTLLIFISRIVSKNLNRVADVSSRIADGDLAVEPIDYEGKDEIGRLAASVNTMSDSLRKMIQQIAEVSQTLSSQSEELTQSSNEVNIGAEQIAATMQELSAGAEEQASQSSEISSIMSHLNSKINEANQESDTLQDASDVMLDLSKNGKEQMDRSVTQMNEINEIVQASVEQVKGLDQQSQEISKLVEVIQGIAKQTNLLALNAAIEAARAGESGRGFAVVANEVRKLSEQVASSVTEITTIIDGVQKETRSTVNTLQNGYQKVIAGNEQMEISRSAFDSINEGLYKMIQGIKNVSTHLYEIRSNGDKVSAAGEEIAAASEQAAAGIEQSSATAQQQSSSMQEITAGSEALASLAEDLNGMVQTFKM